MVQATFYLVRVCCKDSADYGELSVAKHYPKGYWFVPGHYEYTNDEEFSEVFEVVKELDLKELAAKK
jgi:hypothetical protein